ncbi:MAG: hypothetical protein KatS3mg105_4073 [Gemmatales bacterium]|nr:MAG: hypothetical protein KatS3mg105_4073 [Gemmatales bacterium]
MSCRCENEMAARRLSISGWVSFLMVVGGCAYPQVGPQHDPMHAILVPTWTPPGMAMPPSALVNVSAPSPQPTVARNRQSDAGKVGLGRPVIASTPPRQSSPSAFPSEEPTRLAAAKPSAPMVDPAIRQASLESWQPSQSAAPPSVQQTAQPGPIPLVGASPLDLAPSADGAAQPSTSLPLSAEEIEDQRRPIAVPQPTESAHGTPSPEVGQTSEDMASGEVIAATSEKKLEPTPVESDRFPIDLGTAFRLAGANNLQIALALERIEQAQARLAGARALWLPDLQGGVGYNVHDGRIQDTQGAIVDVRRSSLFAGGGANLGGAPLTGGANGPARFFVGLPIADAIFRPLAERQLVRATNAASSAVFNDTLLQVAQTYFDLVQAQGQAAIAREAVENAEKLVHLIDSRVRAGNALPADDRRARADLSQRRREYYRAQENVHFVSAELVRLLRLDPNTVLIPLENQPVPIEIVSEREPLPDLIAHGLTNRPELAQHQALVGATLERLRHERWRPFIPTVQLGVDGGGFGGGRDSFFGRFNGRVDFDALLVWEMRNLGFGNMALRRERASQNAQAALMAVQIQDRIAAEIAQAYYRVQLRRRQIQATEAQVRAAAEAVPLNFKGILGGQLRAIEAQQAITALADARNQYLDALIAYNKAQFELVRAIGIAPGASAFCERTEK